MKLVLRILGELVLIALYLLALAILVLVFIVLVAGCAPQTPAECPPERCIVQ